MIIMSKINFIIVKEGRNYEIMSLFDYLLDNRCTLRNGVGYFDGGTG